MRVLVTGHEGYIGSVMVPLLRAAGHEVVGLDTGLFRGCTLGPVSDVETIRKDLRAVEPADLESFDAVTHLAALSNDPVGELNPEITYDINHRASVRLAEAARSAGVERFVFSSSCSMYGAASPEDVLDEGADFNPVTAYAESKVFAERDLAELVRDDFTVTCLRNATAYGWSPYFRADLVVNNLAGWAFTTGDVLIKSDGTPWRPIVHVEDICRAFRAVLEAPREHVHGEAFNVGRNEENYQIRDIATAVEQIFPGSSVTYAEGGAPDTRCYRADFSKIASQLPEFDPQWTLRKGIEELADAYRKYSLTLEDLEGPRFMRIQRLREHLAEQRLDANLRWVS